MKYPKNKTLLIRINEKELKVAKSYAKAKDKSLSEYVRAYMASASKIKFRTLEKYLMNLDVIYNYQEEGEILEIPCRVCDIIIETYYFEEKNEPIQILVNLSPIEKIHELKEKYNIDEDEYDVFSHVSLSQITKL
jgi:hypothetical protein